ncbi:hypothetical protein OFD51_34700, partial [Escherichia coli]|nr:hypothetical protein [Escherichia coli]
KPKIRIITSGKPFLLPIHPDGEGPRAKMSHFVSDFTDLVNYLQRPRRLQMMGKAIAGRQAK